MNPSRILVVEDELIIAKEIEYQLTQLGYSVVDTVATGEDAIRVAGQEHPDLILMDIMLAGELDGTQAAARIRQAHDIPVIFSTAYTDQETVDRAKPAAPYGYLIKPFDQTELRISLETALYKHEVDSKLRASERRLRQARKMEAVGTLASGIAHDFNNILSAIIGYSEIAMAKVPATDSLHKPLDRIHRAGRRAKKLVQLLLDYSRPPDPDREPVDIVPLAREVMDMVAPSVPDGVEMVFVQPEKPCSIKADPTQIHQVVMNLVTNAVDAMKDQGGMLTVRIECAGECGLFPDKAPLGEEDMAFAALSVQDEGPGMSAEVRERVFDPFFTTKPSGEGTGMGLAVVHGIVKSYGGWVDLETAPGKGSVFTVYLPRQTEL